MDRGVHQGSGGSARTLGRRVSQSYCEGAEDAGGCSLSNGCSHIFHGTMSSTRLPIARALRSSPSVNRLNRFLNLARIPTFSVVFDVQGGMALLSVGYRKLSFCSVNARREENGTASGECLVGSGDRRVSCGQDLRATISFIQMGANGDKQLGGVG